MDSSRVNSRRGPVRALVIGIALGLGLGLLAVQVFVLLFLLPIVAIGVVWSARTTPSITPDSVATAAGILVGMGSILPAWKWQHVPCLPPDRRLLWERECHPVDWVRSGAPGRRSSRGSNNRASGAGTVVGSTAADGT